MLYENFKVSCYEKIFLIGKLHKFATVIFVCYSAVLESEEEKNHQKNPTFLDALASLVVTSSVSPSVIIVFK